MCEAGQATRRPQEHRPHQVVGVVGGAEHPGAVRVEAISVLLEQHEVGPPVASTAGLEHVIGEDVDHQPSVAMHRSMG